MRLGASRIIAVRIAILAASGSLLFAGFGCKPVLDARTNEPVEKPSEWIIEPPNFTYTIAPGGVGRIYIDMRTASDVTVTANLTGPGVPPDAQQTRTPDAQGKVRFSWETTRLGHFKYTGSIIYNELIVETFDGGGDLY